MEEPPAKVKPQVTRQLSSSRNLPAKLDIRRAAQQPGLWLEVLPEAREERWLLLASVQSQVV